MSLWLICSHCGSLPPLTIMFCNNFDKWNSRAEINISGIACVRSHFDGRLLQLDICRKNNGL